MSLHPAFQCPDSFYDRFQRKDGDDLSTHYCPGCGHGNIHKYIAEAIDDLGIQDRSILVSPVGCAVFAYYYLDVGNVQAAHGRCPAVATGLKRACPESIVLGYQGDGDLAAIGANEIVQAANRGENITTFFINNAIYGMTGGQMAPTTLLAMPATTAPAGRHAHNDGFPIRMCELLGTLTAPYYLERVAVGDPKHNAKARRAVHKAIRYQMENRGFSLVEILSPCPTGWKKTPVESAAWTLSEMTRVFPLGVIRDGHELSLGHPRLRTTPSAAQIPGLLDLAADVETRFAPAGEADQRFKISGFGGQGVLMLGTVLAHAGMLSQLQVSWMPSYGPEMRGGTAYCDVTLSHDEIGSPMVQHPTILVAMNGPSLERFGGAVAEGGTIFYNSSLIDQAPKGNGIRVVAVPASGKEQELGGAKVANMVMLGAMLAAGCGVTAEAVRAALPAATKSRPDLLQVNLKALELGSRHS